MEEWRGQGGVVVLSALKMSLFIRVHIGKGNTAFDTS